MTLPINDDLRQAIAKATKEVGQPAKVGSLLVAWLNDMSQQELDKSEHGRHLDLVRGAVALKNAEASDED